MSKYLTKYADEQAYETARLNRTFSVPNTSLIMSTGKVKFTPSFIPSNVGIRGANGVCYSLSDWNALNVADKPTPVGAYLWDDVTGHGFVIHGTLNTGFAWSNNTSVVVPGVTTTTSSATALLDLNGLANSNAVLAAVSGGTIGDAPLFSWARGLNFIDSGLTGYIGSCGEMEMIRLNLADINACRAAIGHSEIVFAGNYWSSTQCSANCAWLWYRSYWYSDFFYKNGTLRGLALAAL